MFLGQKRLGFKNVFKTTLTPKSESNNLEVDVLVDEELLVDEVEVLVSVVLDVVV